MTNDDDRDIHEVREFRSGLADPGAERLARIQARVANRATPARGRWNPRGLAVPAIAGAAVLAIGTGAAVVFLDGSGSQVGSTPANPPASSSTEPAPESEKTSSTAEPAAPAEHQAAVNLLERFANEAGTGPAPLSVPNGQLLYVRGGGAANNGTANADGSTAIVRQTSLHEMWVDPNGAIAVMIRVTDDGQQTLVVPDPNNPRDNHEEEVARQRDQLTREGPSLTQPTPAYLAALPTDPAALLDLLKSTAVQAGGPWSPEHAMINFLRNFLYNNEPLISPAARTALYRAMSTMDSISSTGQVINVDGRKTYAIGQSERGQRQELLLDAETGRVVGGRLFFEDNAEPSYDLWTHAVVAKAGDTP